MFALKRKRKEILDTPAGEALNALIDKEVFQRQTCQCGAIGGYDPETGLCSRCRAMPATQWSDSFVACHALIRKIMCDWPFQRRNRFLDYVSEAISCRLRIGKMDARQWLMHYQPEDICRAALLTLAEPS